MIPLLPAPPASLDAQQGPERIFLLENVRIQSELLVNGLCIL